MNKRAIFLDRDGVLIDTDVINSKPIAINRLERIKILDGVKEAIQFFKKKDLIPIVVTNQPDVRKGLTEKSQVELVNDYLSEEIGIEHFYVCYHDEQDQCDCRKPKTGLLLYATKKLNLDLKDSLLVGDRWSDILAGQHIGCKCFFINYNYGEKKPEQPYVSVKSLFEVAIQMGYTP